MPEPELLQQTDFVADPDALYAALVSEVAWEEHIKARKTASFGQAYNYSRIAYAVTPMHPRLVLLVDHLEATTEQASGGFLRARVKRIPQSVAEEVQGQNGQR